MASKSTASGDMSKFKQALAKASQIVVISGAGISAESGIPTFRGAGGFWRKYESTRLATPEAFRKSPSLVWEFYHYRRELVLTKKPNQAHLSIAELEKQLAQEGSKRKLTILTQNVDGLHKAAGSSNVVEIHGSLFKTRCTVCANVKDNRDSPICEALRGRGAPDLDKDLPEIPVDQLPRCKQSSCNGLLRPHIVWFGENLHQDALDAAESAMEDCDLCLVVGTSSVVTPAAWWAPQLAARGVPVAEFNMEKTPVTDEFQFHFEGPCSRTIPEALGT
ncbi:NAD-dependent protein deacylase sirtuin-5, mitochondrial-like [Macrosteles quadrilineatus]|uniref:NAD-dependent protein deacylase sirtuin-5, mitochondrial-like n=1 Tax=Macrosteles quadrilineatus TaxID=74068 RepID=UPI0023E24324|nr:NAD-dependent protein deacylase sirtuin-5, mitochondrial-like [Macrosteles quadrilineatus]XP_054284331.1 NAD-dependent protein deacylase sirtuin-5, mitochondrial-like [Macrosteles quadrilineatus]XP_054284332.1 NAD-dependent protein deacylase sirtuin-5, mitochondrial-like [Macrosteles quadrilineatus]